MHTPTDTNDHLATVSFALLQDWINALQSICPPRQLAALLDQSGIGAMHSIDLGRISHHQFVQLYQLAAVSTGDEMMGLWSRPIRAGALKHLCTVMMGASSMSGALFRFTTFWNLLLDDFRLELTEDATGLHVDLIPITDQSPQRFGHMLLLKLTHGITSWLAHRELPLISIEFPFKRPSFAEDYAILFPAPIYFDSNHARISFEPSVAQLSINRTDVELNAFLNRAPRDWIFTTFREHSLPLRVRSLIAPLQEGGDDLQSVASALYMTPRTLIRRLKADGTSFQSIKDGLRRDIAILALSQHSKSIETISQSVGFSSVATFHRAFKRWTGLTPSAYRKAQLGPKPN